MFATVRPMRGAAPPAVIITQRRRKRTITGKELEKMALILRKNKKELQATATTFIIEVKCASLEQDSTGAARMTVHQFDCIGDSRVIDNGRTDENRVSEDLGKRCYSEHDIKT